MLRYREGLGLLPPVRARGNGAASLHRHFGEDDVAAVAFALAIEKRFDVSPAALSFGLRVLTDPEVRDRVAELGRRVGRLPPRPARALEFEKERALRLLSLNVGGGAPPPTGPFQAGVTGRPGHGAPPGSRDR
jgi:MerR family copper efflux transcriptional regulator